MLFFVLKCHPQDGSNPSWLWQWMRQSIENAKASINGGGSWGGSVAEKRGTILWVFINLLPVILFMIPGLLPVFKVVALKINVSLNATIKHKTII